MAVKWINTGDATIERARELLAARVGDQPIYVRWYRTYDNPYGGGAFGKSKQYCTVKLIGVTAKRLKVKETLGPGVFAADPKHCFFALREVL